MLPALSAAQKSTNSTPLQSTGAEWLQGIVSVETFISKEIFLVVKSWEVAETTEHCLQERKYSIAEKVLIAGLGLSLTLGPLQVDQAQASIEDDNQVIPLFPMRED